MSGGRLSVKKTWKLYLGGAFVRSESGRTVATADGEQLPAASRKDLRDALRAAEAAQPGWARATAALRGQILYRLAEVMEARREELAGRLVAEGASAAGAAAEVAAAIDRAVSTAGWTDKISAVLSTHSPVASPHHTMTTPGPVGVVGCVAPDAPALLGLVGAVLPIVAGGNATAVVLSARDARVGLAWAECLATSDFPGGVVNLLSGARAELALQLGKHLGVRALDLWDLDDAAALAAEQAAAESVKRVVRRAWSGARWADPAWAGSPGMLEPFLEARTVWHPTLV